MLLTVVSLKLVAIAVFMTTTTESSPQRPSGSTFVAAVYEYPIIKGNVSSVSSKADILAVVMRNMDAYEEQMRLAKQQNASIIVFPEYGITGWEYPRDIFNLFLEDIPDPKTTSWNACQDPKANSTTPILHRLSCLAKTYNMYLVANMGDRKPCSKDTDPYCPKDGRYQYNTNVAFDNRGTLVARYHKQHPFRMETKWLDPVRTPEYITFDTPFGKFGTFICYDALFLKPAIGLVDDHGIDHVAFPTAWFDAFPLLTAVGFHSSWARGMGVNFLSANSHTPELLNTGSGIYSATGARKYYRSFSPKGALLVASLPIKPQRKPTTQPAVVIPKSDDQKPFSNPIRRDLFLLKELAKVEDKLSVCYNGSETCCSLEYKMAEKRDDEMYALGVYDGRHSKYYMRVCTVIKCKGLTRESCGGPVENASTIFESFALQGRLNTRYVFPQVLADHVTLLPGEWDHNMPVTRMWSMRTLSKGLVAATMFGRVYEKDDEAGRDPSAAASAIAAYSVLISCLMTFRFL